MNIDIAPGKWIFDTALRHEDLSFSWEKLMGQAPQAGIWRVDATALSVIDSSCLAFLLLILRTARKNKVTLQFQGLQDSILSLMRVYGILSLFTGVIDENGSH